MDRKRRDFGDGGYVRWFIETYGEKGLLQIAHLFVEQNLTPHKIAEELKYNGVKTHHIHTQLLPAIIDRGWLNLKTPENNNLAKKIKELGSQLDAVRVTPAATTDDVANHTADIVSDLVWQLAQQKGKERIHVGFSGGNTMRRVFQKLVRLVSAPEWSLPEETTVVCHALVAGFSNAPGTEPSGFFTYLDDSPTTFNMEFVQFHAPAFVPASEFQRILDLPAIAESRSRASFLDLIVTSAASFSDRHSQLRKYYYDHQNSDYKPNTKDDVKRLENDNCLGDMLWQPFSSRGPITMDGFDHKPVTVIDLKDLPDRIKDQQTKVVLVIGPCAAKPNEGPCVTEPNNGSGVPESNDTCKKDDILGAILKQQQVQPNTQRGNAPPRYITHLVVDKVTAQKLFQRNTQVG